MFRDAFKLYPVSLAALIVLNLVPVYGVVNWGWQSFDLIFLYWMENVVIGEFALARMLVRPYDHPLELVFPLLLAPFFAFHYGAFCWGHGTFVVSLFGPESLNSFELLTTVQDVLASQTMLFALVALTSIQAIDWARDVSRRGLGADNVKDLMVKPYRRIVVLHITILGAGFALSAMNEPMIGLVVLVLVKTISDAWHWRRDSEREEQAEAFVFSPRHLEEMQEKFPRPVVTVNGVEREFSSFAELKRSSEFRMAQAVMRMIGAGEELKAMTTYLDLKVIEEHDRVGWSGDQVVESA